MSKGKKQKNESSDNDDLPAKPFVISRVFAFLIDTFLVMLLSSLVVSPFVNSKEMSVLLKDASSTFEQYQKSEITVQEYNVELSNIQYKMAKEMGLATIFSLFFGVIFYVVYPLYFGGQTIGKQLMKLRVISVHGDLTANQLLFRSLIANSMLLDTISILFLMLSSRNVYTNCVEIFSFIQYIVMIVSFFMIVYGKEGYAIHDRLVHTKVVVKK